MCKNVKIKIYMKINIKEQKYEFKIQNEYVKIKIYIREK